VIEFASPTALKRRAKFKRRAAAGAAISKNVR